MMEAASITPNQSQPSSPNYFKDAFGAVDLKKLAKSKINSLTSSVKFKAVLKQIFKDGDRNNNGAIEKDEIYEIILLMYLELAQFSKINKKLIPKKDYVYFLFEKFDSDKSNNLSFEQFEALSIILLEGAVYGMTTQFVCGHLIGPSLSLIIVYVMSFNPHQLVQFLLKIDIIKMIIVTIVNMLILPYVVDAYEALIKRKATNSQSNY